MPKFSILVPTRNRPEWLRQCLEAISKQDFPDYEIVVSDNSDEENAIQTRRIVNSISAPSIRYIRTGNLSMADNWQHGLKEIQGEYFLVLSDKLLLVEGLLSFLNERISKDEFDAAVWHTGREDQLAPIEKNLLIEAESIAGKDIWRNAGLGVWSMLHRTGARGMNSCVKTALVHQVESTLGVKFFRPTTPDYTMALTLAALNIKSHFYNLIGVGFIAGADGNGMACLMAPDEETVGRKFSFPPLDNLPLPFANGTNLIYQDILAVNAQLPAKDRCEIHWENYFLQNIHTAVDADDLGGFSPQREKILRHTLAKRSLRERLSLIKTVLRQETEVLIYNRRITRKYQFSRMCRLLNYAVTALIPARTHEEI